MNIQDIMPKENKGNNILQAMFIEVQKPDTLQV